MSSMLDPTLLPSETQEEVDPLSGLANLMDVMLVFACGLIVALVGFYGVDIASQSTTQGMTEVEGQLSTTQEEQTKSASSYQELGTAYQDPSTGKIYVVQGN